jgi:hypothetical protein
MDAVSFAPAGTWPVQELCFEVLVEGVLLLARFRTLTDVNEN